MRSTGFKIALAALAAAELLGCSSTGGATAPLNAAAQQRGPISFAFVNTGLGNGPVQIVMADGEVLNGTYRRDARRQSAAAARGLPAREFAARRLRPGPVRRDRAEDDDVLPRAADRGRQRQRAMPDRQRRALVGQLVSRGAASRGLQPIGVAPDQADAGAGKARAGVTPSPPEPVRPPDARSSSPDIPASMR